MRYTSGNPIHVATVEAVFLDGVKQRGVFEADTDEGFIIAGVLDERGGLMIDMEKGEVMLERREGVVTVTLRDGQTQEKAH